MSIGSAYTTIAADDIARFQRLRGRRVTLVTGTDEHGEKIAAAAAAKGQAPKQHCDGVVAAFQDLWRLVRARRPQRFTHTGRTPGRCACGGEVAALRCPVGRGSQAVSGSSSNLYSSAR